MENRDFVLFFFIIYDIISSVIFMRVIFNLRDKNKELENYTDELHNELAKLRK